jgi:tRNA pseudouridine38-40 synthase
VVITGSSRTDAGVHSTGLTANFHLPVRIEPDSLRRALNSLLPKDIRVVECVKADRTFNARFHVKDKTYEYRIYNGQILSPFLSRYATHIPYPLHLRKMKKSLRYFLGEKDFSSFTSDEPQKRRLRHIASFKMKVRKETITFTIRGRSFLRYMVRNIVGTLIDVGRGKIEPADIPAIFEARDRRAAGQTAPAKGLSLLKVTYENQK